MKTATVLLLACMLWCQAIAAGAGLGAFVRHEGMVSYTLELNENARYVFRQADCFTSESQSGEWVLKDGVVVLTGIDRPNEFRVYPLVASKEIALLPLKDFDSRKNDTEESRLFMRQLRDRAAQTPNKSLEPTATAVTPRADARGAPAVAVAHH